MLRELTLITNDIHPDYRELQPSEIRINHLKAKNQQLFNAHKVTLIHQGETIVLKDTYSEGVKKGQSNCPTISQYLPYELLNAYDNAQEQTFQKEENPEFIPENSPSPHSLSQIRNEIQRRLDASLPDENQKTRIQLKSINPVRLSDGQEIKNQLAARYQLFHNTQGRSGTVLDFDVVITLDNENYVEKDSKGEPKIIPRIKIALEFGEIQTENIPDAFAKLSEWCDRAAVALKTAPKQLKHSFPA